MIPKRCFQGLEAHTAINDEFRVKFVDLCESYRQAVAKVIASCEHDWSDWITEYRSPFGEEIPFLVRSCRRCGHRDIAPTI